MKQKRSELDIEIADALDRLVHVIELLEPCLDSPLLNDLRIVEQTLRDIPGLPDDQVCKSSLIPGMIRS